VRVVYVAVCVLWPSIALAQIAPCPDQASEPPLSSPPLYRCAEIVLHPVNETMLDPSTYGRQLRAPWSRPSEGYWAPYTEESVRADFWNLWNTGFLEDLRIEVIDEPYRNGVPGKHVVFHLEERSRLKLVSYEPADPHAALKVDVSRIEKELRDRHITLQIDGFVDQATIARANAVVRELYANEGYGDVVVVPEQRPVPGGPKLLAVIFRITPGPRWRVRRVSFVGNDAFGAGTLRRQLRDSRPRRRWLPFVGDNTYRPAKFADDADRLREFYQSRGFPFVQIGVPQVESVESRDPDVRWVDLRIPLDENGRYHLGTVTVSGTHAVPADAAVRLFGVRQGDPYSIESIRKGIGRLRDLYGALGFWRWSSDIDQHATNGSSGTPPTMDLTLTIDEGKRFFINRISFTGNTTTRDDVLRRELMVREGGVFSTEALKMSLRRINQLGVVAPIEPDSDDIDVTQAAGTDDHVDVAVKVKEQHHNQMSFGAGFSELSGFFGQMSFQTGNFMGRGETVSVSAQRGSIATAYDVSVSSPYLMGRPISGGAQVYSHKNDYYLTTGQLGYSEVREGVTATTGLFVAPFTRLFLALTRERVEAAALDDLGDLEASGASFEGSPLFSASFSEGVYQESRVGPTLVYNTVDRPDRPRRGMRLTAKADFAVPVLGGTVQYVRPEAEAVVFVPHTRRTAIGARGSIGWLYSRDGTDSLPYYRRYFLGGDADIRGVDFRTVGPFDDQGRAIGGTRYVLFNVEYYVDIGPVRALAFHDAGQAFAEGEPLNLRLLRTSSGVEARFTMPMINVPVRIIYAWNIYRDSFQDPHTFKFGVGTTF
jgi:outer membrane protein insertion porin family